MIPNGIDTEAFHPTSEERCRVRAEWGVNDRELLIGLVGRLDPMKDHATFLMAGQIIRQRRDNVRLVCVGDGQVRYRRQLEQLGSDLGLGGAVTWAGKRGDMGAVYNALDILTVASAFGEGFSNAVGEAMACGVPCVVTDVGDSAHIVGETGLVVPPRDPAALAGAWDVVLDRLRANGRQLKDQVRARVVREFRLDVMVQRTLAALESLVDDAARA